MICHPGLVNDSDVNDHAATLHLSTLKHVEGPSNQYFLQGAKTEHFHRGECKQGAKNAVFWTSVVAFEDGLSGEEVRNEDLKMRTKRPFTNKLDQQPTAKRAKF